MAYMNKYQSDDYRREELIRIIEHSVEKTDSGRVGGFILLYDDKVLY